MVSVARNNNKFAYGVNSYIVDTVDELDYIQTGIGSTAIVDGVHYYLNNDGEWVQLGSGSGSGSSGSGDSALTEPEILALLT